MPETSETPAGPDGFGRPKPVAGREAEIRRAAVFAEKRRTEEAAIKAKVRQRKALAEERGEVVAEEFAQKKLETKQRKKDYRKNMLDRKRQQEEEKRRLEKEEQLKKAVEAKREAEAKKKSGYMKELREQADLKEALRVYHYKLKLEWEAGQKKAEFEHRQKFEQAQFKHNNLLQELEQEERNRKEVSETEMRHKIYQLEGWHRMKQAAVDSELVTERARIRSRNPYEAEQQRTNIETVGKVKKKQIENEFIEKKQQFETEHHYSMNRLAEELKNRRDRGRMELAQTIAEADRQRKNTLDALEHKYNALLHGQKG